MAADPEFMIPIMALTIPIIVAPIAIVAGAVTARRKFEHTERMKALELGRDVPGRQGWFSPGFLSLAIGVFLPLCLMGGGWLAYEFSHNRDIFEIVGAVGGMGVLCGGFLGWRSIALTARAREMEHEIRLATLNQNSPTAPNAQFAKMPTDPDIFDVVDHDGRRRRA